jgi:type IV pilus assembly protein PilO
MKLEDIARIDPKNLGLLPIPVKAVILIMLLVIVLAAGLSVFLKPAYDELEITRQKEAELRVIFLAKKEQAINLPIYKQQMVDIERSFGALLRQLPNKSEMDGLVTDINQAGLEQGLEFELFKPGQELPAEFYAVMPINIKLTGDFYQLGAFAYSISKLSRIVTLNNIKITPVVGKDQSSGVLTVEAVAKTYRYLDGNEAAIKKKQADKKKPK